MLRVVTLALKILIVLLILIYVSVTQSTSSTITFDAILTLIFSAILLFKSRKNLPIFLVFLFIFYCNYSIVTAEYLIRGDLAAPIYEVKTIVNYGLTIRVMLLFSAIISLFYKESKMDILKFKLVPKDNIVIFISLFCTLLYVLFFEIDRGRLTEYSVRISPFYEYSTLLFIFSYYYSGNSKLKHTILTILLIVFVLQDFYYGGRVTSLQLIFLFLVTFFVHKLSIKIIVSGAVIGIFVNSLVGMYRQNYSLESANLLDILIGLKESYFVFSTPVYAYYASVTHIAATHITDFKIEFHSLISFVISIFIGSNPSISDGNVTAFVAENFFNNIGGGIIPTHFYFWLGWIGVVIISIILVMLLNSTVNLKYDYLKICLLIVIVTVPRWYLYSPLSLFRPLLLISVLFLIFKVVDNISAEKKSFFQIERNL